MSIRNQIDDIRGRKVDYTQYARKTPLQRTETGMKPFDHLGADTQQAIDDQIDVVKGKALVISLVKKISEILRTAESGGEQDQKEALKNIQITIFPRLNELFSINEELVDTGALPPDSGFKSESELLAERSILEFIYGQVDPEEVVAFLGSLSEGSALATESNHSTGNIDDGMDGLSKKMIEGEPDTLPNDFFRFLWTNKVKWERLVPNAPKDLITKEEKIVFFEENLFTLGSILISIVLDQMKSSIVEDGLDLPSLPDYKIGRVPGGAEKDYDALSLLKTVAEGFPPQSSARKAAEKFLDSFTLSFQAMQVISGRSKDLKSAKSEDSLKDMYYPLADPERNRSIPSWFDGWFWLAILGKNEERIDPNTGVKTEQWVDGPWSKIKLCAYDDQTGEWVANTLSLKQQFFASTQGILRAGSFGASTGGEDAKFEYLHEGKPDRARPQKFSVILSDLGKPLRPGMAHYLGRHRGERRYKPKTIRQEAFAPSKMFPFTTEQPSVKVKRKATFDAIKHAAAPVGNTEQSGKFAALLAAQMMEVWLEGARQDCELAPNGGSSWGELLGQPDKNYQELVADGTLYRAFTEKGHSFDPGHPGPGIKPFPEHNSPSDRYEGITLIQKLVLEGKLRPYVLGVRDIDKIFHMEAYAQKVKSSPEGQESRFQTRAIGVLKTNFLTFGQYYQDYETGLTINDLLAQGDEDSLRAITRIIGSGTTQNWCMHIKDGLDLTKIARDGFPSGSLTNLGEIDVKTGSAEKINEKLINDIRGFYRVLKGYQFGRDAGPKSASTGQEFHEKTSRLSADEYIIIRLRDNKGGATVDLTTRHTMFYHVTPHDLYKFVDSQLVGPNTGSCWVEDHDLARNPSSLPVMEITVSDFSDLKKVYKNIEGGVNPKKYLEALLIRDLVGKYLYMTAGSDVLKRLGKSDMLILGMIFCPEIREKFEKGLYTRGPIGNALLQLSQIPGLNNFFDKEFMEVEVPDIAGPNLFPTEESFFEMLVHIGYVYTSDEFLKSMQASVSELSAVFGKK